MATEWMIRTNDYRIGFDEEASEDGSGLLVQAFWHSKWETVLDGDLCISLANENVIDYRMGVGELNGIAGIICGLCEQLADLATEVGKGR